MSSSSRRVLPGAGILLMLAAGAAFAADLNPAALVYKAPEQLKWRDPTGAAGINQAVLVGNPDGAKNEEAWLIIVGEGPATLTRVEEAK